MLERGSNGGAAFVGEEGMDVGVGISAFSGMEGAVGVRSVSMLLLFCVDEVSPVLLKFSTLTSREFFRSSSGRNKSHTNRMMSASE